MTTTLPGPISNPEASSTAFTAPFTTPPSAAGYSQIRQTLRPLGSQILATDVIENVLEFLQKTGADYVTVADGDDSPLGVITRRDVERLQQDYPGHWSAMRCGNVIETPTRYLRPEESYDAAVELFRDHGVRPLLELEGATGLGVLEPTAVFQWCAAHPSAVLEELAYLASGAELPDWDTVPA